MDKKEQDMRAALEWETGQKAPAEKSVWAWLVEAVQGDFAEDRSTGQVAFDTAISMIPVIDQICDVRDLVANCKNIAKSKPGESQTMNYVALCLTLIGLFPSLGSLVKGVLKIMFTFIRKHGLDHISKALDPAMTWVVTLLRRREVQLYLKKHQVDAPFTWLAKHVREVKSAINVANLLAWFDRGIGLFKGMLDKINFLPMPALQTAGAKTLQMMQQVRHGAEKPLGAVNKQIEEVIEQIAKRLDAEQLFYRHGILDAKNVHFKGTLPESSAVTLMRGNPPPKWLSKGANPPFPGEIAKNFIKEPDYTKAIGKGLSPDEYKLAQARGDVWPELTNGNIESFAKGAIKTDTIHGPARLYRVISPSAGAMGDCWVSEEVWLKILNEADPKAAWRKNLAVWPDWNANGQFAVMEIPAGHSINVWRGTTSSQVKDTLPDAYLEGGWEQIIVKTPDLNDDFSYFSKAADGSLRRAPHMDYGKYKALSEADKQKYVALREKVNHPNIKAPFDTGWGSTDFAEQFLDVKIGLPNLSGQVTNMAPPPPKP